MPNRAYNDQPSDTKAKEGAKGGMKNNDGRLKGGEYDKQANVPGPDFKSVGVEPNNGAPTLNGGKNRPGMDEAAY